MTYAFRIPTDPAHLAAIRPSDRARFDRWQEQIFLARTVRVGDHVCFRPGLGAEPKGGTVDAVLKGRDGYPVLSVAGFAVEVHDLERPAEGLWFLLPGDVVEANVHGEWTTTTVRFVSNNRQFPTYVVEGSRKHYYPSTLRLPAAVPA